MRKSMSTSDIAALSGDHKEDEDLARPLTITDIYNRYRSKLSAARKFVSLAEAVHNYEAATPVRFHSTRPKILRAQGSPRPSGSTIPQSPILPAPRCKPGTRPVHAISQKEKEAIKIEEIKKFRRSALPIPKSVIERRKNLPKVQKKPITVPQPFNLTEIHKKIPQSSKVKVNPQEVFNFKARPAPKHILEKPHIPVKPLVQVSKPVSADHVKSDFELAQKKEKEEKQQLRKCPWKPFSLATRDADLKRRREERSEHKFEEERKQHCSFKAQPVPGGVQRHIHSIAPKESLSTSSENKDNIEARPPVQCKVIKTEPFEFTTEKQSADREGFDKKKEKLRPQEEKEHQEAKEKAKAELRAKLVHHAKPVPAPLPFHSEKSDAPLTVPESSKFVRKQKID